MLNPKLVDQINQRDTPSLVAEFNDRLDRERTAHLLRMRKRERSQIALGIGLFIAMTAITLAVSQWIGGGK